MSSNRENDATGRVRAVPRHAVIRGYTRLVRLFPNTRCLLYSTAVYTVYSTAYSATHDGCHPPATLTGPPPHAVHLHGRIRSRTPPRRARIRTVPPREEGLGCAGIARARRVVRFRFSSPRLYTIVVIFVALRRLDCLLIGGRGARAPTYYLPTVLFIGNRASRRSFTHCLFSRWPRAASISLRSRLIARSGGIRASARSLLSRAGKTRTPPREPHCSCRGAHTPTRFFGRYFLWDSIVSLVHYEGMGFVIHGTRLMLFGSYPDKSDGNFCP